MSDTPSSTVAPAKHIPALDGLRGLAVLLVMIFHFTRLDGTTRVDVLVDHITQSGWIGVDLFFVLSGFLITGILYDAKGAERFFRNFYIRRTLRIFPLYYGTLVFLVLILPRLPPAVASGFERLHRHEAWYWAYATNLLIAIKGTAATPTGTIHFWSLAVEEQYYLVWPAVVFFCNRRQLMRVCVGCVVAALVLRVILRLEGVSPGAVQVLTPTRIDSLAVGGFLALAARGPEGLGPLLPRIRWAMLAAWLLLAGIAAQAGWLAHRQLPVQTVGYTALAVGFGGLIAWTCTSPATHQLPRWFAHPFMRFWGKYSYALYVFHPLVGLELRRAGLDTSAFATLGGSQLPGAVLCVVVNIAATLVAALLSWHLYEKQFLKLKARFPYGD